MRKNGPDLWIDALPSAAMDGHKYDRGHTLVLSGPPSSTGAARLAAQAALRAGSGLVTVAAPPAALQVNAMHLTAVMLARIEGADALRSLVQDSRISAIVAGPGLGAKARDLTEATLRTAAAAVLDADALTAFADDPEALFDRLASAQAPVVLTPHAGEFARLFGRPGETLEERCASAAKAAGRTGAIVVLKGANTVIADPAGRLIVNDHASPWLATAGSGDTLAGIIGAFLAGGMDAFRAACAGVWLHGDAGRRAGSYMTAEDLDAALRESLRAL